MDCETFEILGRYEMDRGKQDKHYDFWWNLPRDYMVSSEWGLPPQFENGIVAEDLAVQQVWSQDPFLEPARTRNVQTIDLGANHQMALEIRPAHDPAKDYGFCGVVVDTTNLQGAIFTWWQKDDGTFEAKKTITIDPRPEKAENLPPLLQGFEAVPPLVTDIDLSLDDKYLYVACWGLGEMHQYDVSDPMNPKLAGKVEIGGIARGTKHPNGKDFVYGPQMVEISRDGKRVYWTNSLYSTWDDQFYPDDEGGQMVMANVGENGGLELDKDFYIEFPKGYRSHQIRLEGGDCSTDSFCYPRNCSAWTAGAWPLHCDGRHPAAVCGDGIAGDMAARNPDRGRADRGRYGRLLAD
jgi:selenium-binding protein 1